MSTYIVTRQFRGSPAVGEPVEVPEPRRASTLMVRGYIIPAGSGASVGNATPLVAAAVPLIAVSKLDEFLAAVDDLDALEAALNTEERDTAKPLIQARIDQLLGE